MRSLMLVNPPSRARVYQRLASDFAAIEPPVWAGLIARHVMDRGFPVQILDAEAQGMTVEQTAEAINRAHPGLAAFCIYGQQPSASTQCLPAASAVAGLVDVPTLALGTHPSALPEKTLAEEPFDFVCQGEGHTAICDLLESFPHKRLLHSANAENLDAELPSQAWELLDMMKYRAHNWHLWTGNPDGGYASVQTSLGCPFKCSFCCINAPFGGAGIRYWSPENVVGQMERLVNDYGITNIKIPDEMFTLNPQRVKKICALIIGRGLGDRLNLWAYARVDTVKDGEMLDLMRMAGFRWLAIGIESGSKQVRDGVEKGRFGEAQIVDAIKRVRDCGLNVVANYIFGLPDDTLESMRQTLDFALALNCEWANFYCAMAYPGSPLHAIARSKGWRLPEDGPGWIGYSQHAYETLPLPTETLDSSTVLEFRDAAFLRYFTDPGYLRMIENKFGKRHDVERMTALGKPERKYAMREKVAA